MNAIDKIYGNEIGVAFYWKNEYQKKSNKIQLILKDMGFLLSIDELKKFSYACTIAKDSKHCSCNDISGSCNTLLLRTPSQNVDLAVTKVELNYIETLINHTIFEVELKGWIKNMPLN